MDPTDLAPLPAAARDHPAAWVRTGRTGFGGLSRTVAALAKWRAR